MNTIYGTRCIVNNKYYVGATSRLKGRKREHFSNLRGNRHHSIKLQRAWNKYGENSFVFEVLEEGFLSEFLIIKEQYWMDKLNSYQSGYNSYSKASKCPSGELNGMFGAKPHNKGIPSKRRKPIISYNIETGEVKYFDYVLQVYKHNEAYGPQFLSCISQEKILKNGYCSLYGCFWFYEKDFCIEQLKKRFEFKNKPNPLLGRKRPEETKKRISQGRIGMKFSENHKKNMSESRLGKGVKPIKRNDGIIFNSIKDAAMATGCDRSEISHNLNGRSKTCRGFMFSYLEQESSISSE